MPKKNYRRRGGKRYNRKWFNTNKFTPSRAYELAKQAAKDIWYIKGLVNSEMMHADYAYGPGTNIPNTGFITNITALSQGDGPNNRTGNSVLLRNLSYRFKLDINTSVTSNTTILMMLVKDTQTEADGIPAVTTILQSSTTWSLMNLLTAGRFKIIKRRNYTLTPASGGRPSFEIKGYHKIYDHIRYNGTTANDIQKNGYYMLWLSSETSNYPTIVGSMRIGYHDN